MSVGSLYVYFMSGGGLGHHFLLGFVEILCATLTITLTPPLSNFSQNEVQSCNLVSSSLKYILGNLTAIMS